MSTRNKLILLVFFSLLLLAVGTGLFTMHSVEEAMLREQRQSAFNSVTLAARNAVRVYDLLFYNKVEQAVALRKYIRVVSDTLAELAAEQEDTLTFLRKYPIPDNMTLLVCDRNGTIMLSRGENKHVNPYLQHDIKGRPVAEAMFRLAEKQLPAVTLVRVSDAEGSKRLYGRSFYLAANDVLVGVWSDIGHLDARQAELHRENFKGLRDNFSAVKLGPSGFLFAVDSGGKVHIAPANMLADLGAATVNGVPVSALLKQAAATPDTPVSMPASALLADGGNRQALLFVRHLKGFDWFVGGVAYTDEARAPGRRLSISLVLGVLAAMLAILPLAVWFAAKVTSPLAALAHYARKVPEQDFLQESPPPAELQTLAAARRDPEVSELAKSFLFMDAALRSRVRELMDATIVRERLEGELAAAVEIQTGFLPAPLPDEVCGDWFSLAASLVPAREVGGDLYDFFMLDDDTLCFVIGDVSDKGIPASLFMSMTLTLIRSNAAKHPSPDSLMRNLNETLSKDNTTCMFVTLFIGTLHLRTGEIVYANGGHNPPVLLRANGTAAWLEGTSGPVVGAMDDIPYTLLRTAIEPGDTLFLYTDGLNESMNPKDEFYGNDRMLATLQKAASKDPSRLMEYMLRDVAEHTQGRPPFDDLTILCLRYGKKKERTC